MKSFRCPKDVALLAVAVAMLVGVAWFASLAAAGGASECPVDWPGQGYEGPLRAEDYGRIQYQDYHSDADGKHWYVIRSSDSNGYTTIRAYPASDDEGYQADSPDRVCYLIVREPGAAEDAAEPRQVEFPKEQEPKPTPPPTPYPIRSQPASVDIAAGQAAVLIQDSGARSEVPEGATSEPTTVSVIEVPPPTSDLAVGRVFDFSVGDVPLGAPVTIHIPFELPSNGDPSLVQAVHWNAEARRWELLEGVVDASAGTIAVTTSDLSWFSTWVIEPITELVSAVLADSDELESVICSVDPATSRVGHDIQFSATIVSGTFGGEIYLQTGARDNLRDVADLDIHQTARRSIRPNRTITITDTFQVELPGDYQFICQIYEERTLAPNRLLAGQPVPFKVEARDSHHTDKDGRLGTCDPSLTELLAGEPVTLTATGFEGYNDIFNGINTYSLVLRVYNDENALVETGYTTAQIDQIKNARIEIVKTTQNLTRPGEYIMECQLVGGLVYSAGGALVNPFISPGEAFKLAITAYFSPTLAITGLVENLLDAQLSSIRVVKYRWSPRLEIIPSQIPSQGGNREVTIRVYIQQSVGYFDPELAPSIAAVLPARLDGSSAGSRLASEVSSCDSTEGPGYYETCWEAVFEDVPENSVRAKQNDAGEITRSNHAEVRIEVTANRDISGTAPSGSFSILGRSPYSTDREPLEVLYRETQGEFWLTKDDWTDPNTDIHEWYGVNDFRLLTDAEKAADQVTSLELNDNNLRGDLPAEVGYLTSLKFLILAANDNLQGQIPGSLGELTNLEYLDLSGNRLSRQIPSTLGNLKNLKLLDLSDNNLIGEIPSNFDELPELHSLYLADNRLTGCIPAGLRDLRNNDFDEMDLPFCDVALSGLTISPGQLEPEFETHSMGYSATVPGSQVKITPVNDHGATFEYYVGSSRTPATDADPSAPGFKVDLGCGETTVRIKVISADGEADESYTVAFTREGGGDIVAPTIRSVSNGAELLTVYWNAPETSCPGDIDHYNLRYSLDQDDVDWTEVQRPSGSLSHTISGLTAGTTYRVQAQAVVAGVAGPWSESATGTPRRSSVSADDTVGGTALSPPTGLAITVGSDTPGEITLSWDTVSGATHYRVGWIADSDYDRTPGADWLNNSSFVDRTAEPSGSTENTRQSYTIKNVASGETYWFRVGSLGERFGRIDGSWSDWISHAVSWSVVGSCPAVQANSAAGADLIGLDSLYINSGGDNWTNNTNWLSDTPVSEWYGVTTNESGRVTGLYLGDNQLSGPIPSELANLTDLEELDLTSNQLTGPVPAWLGNLSNLTSLGLWGNQLTGSIPPQLGNLSELTVLSLSRNQLTGSVPSQLADLSNLERLFLSENQLTGAIPTQLEDLSNLTELTLWGNQLTGSIPPQLGNLSELTVLSLSRNQLTGSVPSQLADLSNLERLFLSENQLTGAIPTQLEDLSNLTELTLWGNQLTGSIPPQLGNLSELTVLSLSRNQLTGSVPSQLADLSNLEKLFLSENQLTGAIPTQLEDLSNLTELTLWGNQLTGLIPSELGNLQNLTYLSLRENQLIGPIASNLSYLRNLTYLSLRDNQLTGPIPPELSRLTALTSLDLRGNQLAGPLPSELANLTNLRTLNLRENQLTGTIPISIGALTNLEWLSLQENQFTGEIPAGLGYLNKLTHLNLSQNELTGEVPTSLGGLDNLVRLYISNNQLEGAIPADLGNLRYLTILDLDHNQFTGEVPARLGNLANLAHLDLSNNELTGPLPAWLGHLAELTFLDLDHNQFAGQIPRDLGNLAKLEYLELDHNLLTGQIPFELTSLTNLERLELSSNAFTGCLPAGLLRVPENDLDELNLPTC